jgi:hypothetical protein
MLSWTHRSCLTLQNLLDALVVVDMRHVPYSPNGGIPGPLGEPAVFLRTLRAGRYRNDACGRVRSDGGPVLSRGGTAAPRSCRRSGDFSMMITVSQPPTEEAQHHGYDGGTDGRLPYRIGKIENPADACHEKLVRLRVCFTIGASGRRPRNSK